MADLFSRKAKFEEVKWNIDAVMFHKSRYEGGSVDPLARQCMQYYKMVIEPKENNNGSNT